MDKIKKISSALNDEIIRKNKEYLSLAQAHRVLTSRDLMTIAEVADGKFKELLASNKIEGAYRTESIPKQWRIGLSSHGYLKASKVAIEDFEDKDYSSKPIKGFNGASKLKSGKPVIGRIGWIIIIVIVLIFSYLIDTKNSTRDIEPTVWSGHDGSVYQVVNYLKNEYLRDPDSYQSIEWSELTKGSQKYMVRHKFRAKNGFGGYDVENKIFYLDLEGNVIYVMDY